MAILIFAPGTQYEVDCDELPVDNSLETGIIDLGSASGLTGIADYDTSLGVDYGHGNRFSREETPYMTKIPSKKHRIWN